jgi:hypothetical protein
MSLSNEMIAEIIKDLENLKHRPPHSRFHTDKEDRLVKTVWGLAIDAAKVVIMKREKERRGFTGVY